MVVERVAGSLADRRRGGGRGRRHARLYVAIGATGAGVGTTALRVPTSGVSYESGRVIGCDGLRVPAPGESFW